MLRRLSEDRRVWRVLAGVAAVLAIVAATDGRTTQTIAWAVVGLLWFWHGERRPRRSTVPPHVDDDWARRVLADAGSPTGVPAVKALRDAEPALSLLEAKQLADRVAR